MNKKNPPEIYISDFALVNPLGCNLTEIKTNMLQGTRSGLTENNILPNEGSLFIGAVQGELPNLSGKAQHFNTRNNQLAKLALASLQDEVNDLKQAVSSDRIGVIVGTSTSGIYEGENAVKAELSTGALPEDYDYRMQEMFNLAEFIADELEIQGPAFTISTACSSSAKAFITAKELILSGVIDAAIVGGVDALCGMTVNGFSALDSTSSNLCQPSSINRDGINLGEAAALCVLRTDKGNIKLLGCGESSDAHHMSAPHPEGEGAITTMQQALTTAGILASDVDYINLHGTATIKNDAMESIAVHKVFGNDTPCSSVKGMIGHTLGAAGATEIGLCWLMMQDNNQILIPHCWDNIKDDSLAQIALTHTGQKSKNPIKYCLSNSFAFGGNNVSIIIGF
ncbi:beta-ketoacyl-[acyl-carrier-protein] synthase family protein [Colwellia sp. E2M01]|uniref:beta-ketoacyl-[acyl-carrier-protein] synthase family protein n=1 Tax=Colwellia sp. E2M01 TaxID=2841561 RepID=UPI001C0A163B|nr:beta-ketoacyl-[acyl-carrier-protein] synthase family protein [Colwellia sp. E2M01]MBU2871627.1 beta-ketoacyl-[acyl-carrier-protein] synthase family protein [Colwellia sp. E2M01]